MCAHQELACPIRIKSALLIVHQDRDVQLRRQVVDAPHFGSVDLDRILQLAHANGAAVQLGAEFADGVGQAHVGIAKAHEAVGRCGGEAHHALLRAKARQEDGFCNSGALQMVDLANVAMARMEVDVEHRAGPVLRLRV